VEHVKTVGKLYVYQKYKCSGILKFNFPSMDPCE
jgi:hypothetical protein